MDATTLVSWIVVGAGVLGLLVIVAGIVLAIVGVTRAKELPPVLRALWAVAIVAFPIVGTIVWYGLGDAINAWLAPRLRAALS